MSPLMAVVIKKEQCFGKKTSAPHISGKKSYYINLCSSR